MTKTKIVATIGPASGGEKKLLSMIRNGLDVCRLNFSHGDHHWHRKAIKNIRLAEKKARRKVAIMADIQGPRIRIVNQRKVNLKKGETVALTDERTVFHHRHKKELVLDWHGFYQFVKKGDVVFIEDGLIQLMVTEKKKTGCLAKVVVSGEVAPHKGVNIPAISHHLGFLTDKDLDDLKFILSQDVDFIAASFVASRKDLWALRNLMEYFAEMHRKKPDQTIELPGVISKIERKKAVNNLLEIIDASDGIMVARGDLAIEMPQERVTLLQKEMVELCLKKKKPVIVATQMMASMIKKARPTRAEISDVTNAVVDGADAVMLSNETAVGEYPVEVIEVMKKIIAATEKSVFNDRRLKLSNRFARLLARRKKTGKTVTVKNLEEALQFSSLRQEDVKIKLSKRFTDDPQKAALIWGVD